jgi:hypothetical protein
MKPFKEETRDGKKLEKKKKGSAFKFETGTKNTPPIVLCLLLGVRQCIWPNHPNSTSTV